jgi:hypothetical protein
MYLKLHLDRRLRWCKHMFTNISNWKWHSPKCTGYSDRSQNSPQATKFSYIQRNIQTNQGLCYSTVGYSFHFKHRNHRMLPLQSCVHDYKCNFVHAKYGHPKRYPNTNIYNHRPHYSVCLIVHSNNLAVNLMVQSDNTCQMIYPPDYKCNCLIWVTGVMVSL